MWLRSFERFFRIKNQPLSERETRALALRNWSEELRLVDNVILRVVHLCTSILTEEQVNLTRLRQVRRGLPQEGRVVDPYIEKLVRQTTPEAALTLLREAFEDLHLVLMDLVRLSRIPYATFTAVGKILYREVRRSHLLALSSTRSSSPSTTGSGTSRRAGSSGTIPDPAERKQAAKVFLEFFRLLHYLEYADPERPDEDHLKTRSSSSRSSPPRRGCSSTYIEKRGAQGRGPLAAALSALRLLRLLRAPRAARRSSTPSSPTSR